MNIYGDRGNVIALRYRCEARGIAVDVIDVNSGDPFDTTKQKYFFVSKFLDELNTRQIVFRGENRPLSYAIAQLAGWESIAQLNSRRADLQAVLSRVYVARIMDNPDSVAEMAKLQQDLMAKAAEKAIRKLLDH